MITGLDSQECLLLIENIHGKKQFGKKIFCNGYLSLTPEKPESSLKHASSSGTPVPSYSPEKPHVAAEIAPEDNGLESELDNVENSSIPTLHVTKDPFRKKSFFPSNDLVARRHSISLCDRTPPQKSLASEILENPPNSSEVSNYSLI